MEHGVGVFSALEHSAWGLIVRDSLWLYPAANVAHVLAVIVFFAAVAAMDLIALGAIPTAQPFTAIRRIRPYAIAALLLVAVSGVGMFIAEASALVRNTAFQFKMLTILVGLVNVAAFERLSEKGEIGAGMRMTAGLSMALWLLTVALGRFIAYA